MINIYSHRKQLFEIVVIFHCFYCIYNQINASLVSRRDFWNKWIIPDFEMLVYIVSLINEMKCK